MNSRGTHVTLGANGIYYRKNLRGKTQPTVNTWSDKQAEFEANVRDAEDDAAMNSLTDVDSQAFVEELESKAHQFSFLKPALIVGLIGILFYLYYTNQQLLVSEDFKTVFWVDKRKVHIRALPAKNARSLDMTAEGVRFNVIDTAYQGWVKVAYKHDADSVGFIHASMGNIDRVLVKQHHQSRMDRMPVLKLLAFVLVGLWFVMIFLIQRWEVRRRTMIVNYTMDDRLRGLYDKFMECFQEFAATARIWHNINAIAVDDSRRHGGASQSVDRSVIREVSPHRLPSPYLVINVSVPYMRLADKEVYFFPERIIFRRGRQLGAVFYKHIQIKRVDVRFQENESLPADATVVDQRWQYLNKDGEPDRRFKDNRLLSICQYTEYTFTSEQGWNDTIMTSRTGAMDRFAEFIKLIGEYQQKIK